ncbi:hypothetical protein BDV26DRAFT_276198 [Aspergillus bertholletiae]|uniref:Swi5-dependent recombination DNA repair protein 1 n=1 Tax=Aspergillus bertholletiae TaxID=1226010 RepID=A0A5N7ARJ3_9EURO|nr:hypothetical protein BDV26DRAFT_276198 [Aspergillus bertholletiae]
MSSINLDGKRRRVESAASALSKPFKSPLRRPSQVLETKHEALSKGKENDPRGPSLKHSTASLNDARTLPVISSSPSSACPSTYKAPLTSPLSLEARKRKAQNTHLTSSKKPALSDPVILDLQKQERTLQSRLATLRSELDTAQQALRLETSTEDAELQSLITKWRTISQNAADEVFSGAQERVARIGGMRAWRERMKNSNAQWEKEEMDTWYGSAKVEGVDVDENELGRDHKESHDEEPESKEIEDEQDFTMDFMLKTLNIDLQVIGYDKAHQVWIKE